MPFVTGDSGDKLRITTLDGDGNVINLTGYTVNLYYSLNGDGPLKKTMTVTTAASGEAEYQFAATELSEAGTLEYEIELIDGSSKKTTSDVGTISIKKRRFPEGA